MEHGHAGQVTIVDTQLTGVNASIEVSSAAFGHNEPIPAQYTADGDGLSPPLKWRGVPMSAEAVVVLVEDLPGSDASIPEGTLPDQRCAANDALVATWLPPDPPPGHGVHRYIFQVFALDIIPRFESRPGRAELLDKIQGHVIAKGLLIGTYERK
jgi:phosphatidylethanolamine-binding protein (PEBP) family uncharacterized protein